MVNYLTRSNNSIVSIFHIGISHSDRYLPFVVLTKSQASPIGLASMEQRLHVWVAPYQQVFHPQSIRKESLLMRKSNHLIHPINKRKSNKSDFFSHSNLAHARTDRTRKESLMDMHMQRQIANDMFPFTLSNSWKRISISKMDFGKNKKISF